MKVRLAVIVFVPPSGQVVVILKKFKNDMTAELSAAKREKLDMRTEREISSDACAETRNTSMPFKIWLPILPAVAAHRRPCERGS